MEKGTKQSELPVDEDQGAEDAGGGKQKEVGIVGSIGMIGHRVDGLFI